MTRTVWLALTVLTLVAFSVSLLHADAQKKEERRVDPAKAYTPPPASQAQKVEKPAAAPQWSPPASNSGSGWGGWGGAAPQTQPAQKPAPAPQWTPPATSGNSGWGGWGGWGGSAPQTQPAQKPTPTYQWAPPSPTYQAPAPAPQQSYQAPVQDTKPPTASQGYSYGGWGGKPPVPAGDVQKIDKPSANGGWSKPPVGSGWGWGKDDDRKTEPPKVGREQKIERPWQPPHQPEHGYGPTYQPHHDHYDYNYYYYYDYPTYYYYPEPRYAPAPARRYNDWDDYCEPGVPPGPHLTGQLIGAEIWAADGTFLGVVGPERRKYESICNPEGPYGNPYSPVSILNPRSPYGAARGPLSCWDPDTITPPRLFWHGQFVGYLTANRSLYPRTGPGWIMHRWFQNTPWYRL